MERDGRQIGTDADKLRKRRLSDARNAVRKMDGEQRATFFQWCVAEGFGDELRAAASEVER
tara:strand:+ start:559 stop:741 length:183 start_codon:yes stop_codon:yes gene_type:complete